MPGYRGFPNCESWYRTHAHTHTRTLAHTRTRTHLPPSHPHLAPITPPHHLHQPQQAVTATTVVQMELVVMNLASVTVNPILLDACATSVDEICTTFPPANVSIIHTHTHTHSHTHTHAHIYTHTCTHTHTHAPL